MANKYELVSYLNGISSIMDAVDDGGAQNRPKWLTDEYLRAWQELKDIVKKEQGDETRTSDDEQGRQHQGGADQSGGESSRRV